jgi:hypothetical protein
VGACCRKVYVEFPPHEGVEHVEEEDQPAFRLPGRVSLAVYRAVKMRQLGHKLSLAVLP